MVQTRSAVKRQQAEHRLTTAPKTLVRDATVVEITSSATGLGTHIRWLRPPQGPNEIPEILSPDLTLDPRFVTPVPETPPAVRSPPKLSHQHRIGNPGIFNSGTTVRFNLFRHEVEDIVESARVHGRDLMTEFESYSKDVEGTSSDPRYVATTDTFGNILQPRSQILRSPFPGTRVEASTPLSLGPHGTQLNISSSSFSPTGNQGHDTGYAALQLGPHGTQLDISSSSFGPTGNHGHATGYTALQLGPHGTHVDISQDNFSSTFNQGTPGLTQGFARGLGPNDTVLIGPDGRALRLGY